MQWIKTKKTLLILSFAALALATTSLAASVNTRQRYGKARQPVAAKAVDMAVDDRYAHVLQGNLAMAPAARRSSRQNAPVNAMSFGSPGIVEQARRYIGSNPTGRTSLWCARFLNMLLERSGHSGTGSDMASSFASFGRRVPGPQVGAIAVMSRGKRGGHVGIVSGIDEQGNPIIISGNHGGRVAEAAYSRGRVSTYVMP